MAQFDPRGPFGPGGGRMYAGSDSVLLDARFVEEALRERHDEDTAGISGDAVVGIRNGLAFAAVCWIVIYGLVRLAIS